MARGIYGERFAVSISLFPGVILRRHDEGSVLSRQRQRILRKLRMTLELDFLALCGGEQIDVAAGGAPQLRRRCRSRNRCCCAPSPAASGTPQACTARLE